MNKKLEYTGKEYRGSQYKTGENLNVRISLHERFSTNPYGFSSWLMDQYPFFPGCRVLETGCGTGFLWRGREALTESLGELVLTDLSEGMLREAEASLRGMQGVKLLAADITSLPFEAERFDLVIANMMLYHVEEKDLALEEVRRVLKPGGVFCCATYGEYNLMDFLAEKLRGICEIKTPPKSFTLQNGGALLERHFSGVERRLYPDSFEITEPSAVVEYLLSTTGMREQGRAAPERERLLSAVEGLRDGDGVLRIPKDYGMFVAHRGEPFREELPKG